MNKAPAVLVGLVVMTLLLALPFAIVVRGMLRDQLGGSATAELVTAGADSDWWEEFSAQASGIGTTFTPSIIGFAAVLENVGGLLDNRPLHPTIAAVTVAWLVLWSFLLGGVLDRYARMHPTHSHGFFGACGTHFWRFLRLGALALGGYVVLAGSLHDWIFNSAYRTLTRDLTAERTTFALRIGAYVVFSASLALFALVFDFARIRIVVEDRRSAFGAVLSAGKFIKRHAGRVSRLFLLNAIAILALITAYGLAAPGAPKAGFQMWMALILGQAYIIGRHYLKLLVYASETALFQGIVAHAAYTATPIVVWPDSPAVEAIMNAEPTGAQ